MSEARLHVLVTGSSDGIGRRTASDLVAAGHRVLLHARSESRGQEALAAVPGADGVVLGDLSSIASTGALAKDVAGRDPLDVVIHNAGVGGSDERVVTEDGLSRIFQVNVLAPYLLTALVPRPARLVYLTSGLEADGRPDLDDLQHERGPWDGMQAYSDSKLWDVVLAFAVARRWPQVLSNAVDPGWIKTRMGGPSATDELPEGAATQVWLATSDDPAATVSGRYFKRQRTLDAHPAASSVEVQEGLLSACAEITGVVLPD